MSTLSMRGGSSLQKSAPTANADDSMRFSALDWLLLAIVTIPVQGVFFPTVMYFQAASDADVSDGGASSTIVFALMLVFILGLLSLRLEASIRAVLRSWPIFLFILWAMVSSRWAEIPSQSFNRTGRMLIFALYAVYLIEAYPLRKLLKFIAMALTFATLASLFAVVALPSFAREVDVRGSWRGAMPQKNGLGTASALGFLCAVTAYKARAIRLPYCIGLALLSFIMLVLSNSVTAMIAVIVICAILTFLYSIVHRSGSRLTALGMAGFVGLLAAVFSSYAAEIVTLFGRDTTFTGRSDVWDYARAMIAEKPFWGWGHAAWGMPDFQISTKLALGWPCPHAHNTMLDIRLQLGVPGVALALLVWLIAIRNAIYLMLFGPITVMAPCFSILAFETIRANSETVVIDPAMGEMFWVAFAFAGLAKYHEATRRKGAEIWNARRPRYHFGRTSNVEAPSQG